MRPIQAGYCTYRELCDGTLDMRDLWSMHDMLDLHDYIERKAYEEAENARS